MSGYLDYLSMLGHCSADSWKASLAYEREFYSNAESRLAARVAAELISRLGALTGFTEGILTYAASTANREALRLAKERTGREYVLATSLTHSSVRSACEDLELKLLQLPVGDEYQASTKTLQAAVGRKVGRIAAIVSTFGTTQFGNFEDLAQHPEVMEMQADGSWLHIDAAYGGMIGNLLYPNAKEGYSHADSITIDPYKFIGSTGTAALLLRKGLPSDRFRSSYYHASAITPHTTLTARAGYTVVDMWERLGDDGLVALARQSHANATSFSESLREHGIKTHPVVTGICSIPLQKNQLDTFTQALFERGYLVGKYEAQTRRGLEHGARAVFTPRKPETYQTSVRRFSETALMTLTSLLR